MSKVKFNVQGVEARAGDGEPIPKGVYPFAVESCEVTKPQGKDQRIEVVYVIEGDEQKGRKLFDYINLESEAAAWKLRQFLETFGLVTDKKEAGEFDPAKLVGQKGMVRVTHQAGTAGTQWEGQMQSRVGSTFAADQEEAEVEELDDEAEAEADDEIDLDELDRAELKKFIKDQELELVVKRAWTDGELREAIAQAMEESEDEEDEEEEEDEEGVDLDELDRTELKKLIKEQGLLEIVVKKSMSDDDIRKAIAEAMDDEAEGDEPDSEVDYNDLSVEELQATCKERGLSTKGSKKLLATRLEKDDEASASDEEPF